MAKEPKQLDELFHDTLKDIYFAEKKILATLPKMAKAAQSPDLQKAFEKHRGETEGHVARLEKVFAVMLPEGILEFVGLRRLFHFRQRAENFLLGEIDVF